MYFFTVYFFLQFVRRNCGYLYCFPWQKHPILEIPMHIYVLFLLGNVKKAIVVCGEGNVPYVRVSSFCFYPENKRPMTNTETIPGVVL